MNKVISYTTNDGNAKSVIIEKEIGEGAFGKVYKGILDGVGYVAVKVQKLNRNIFKSLITEVKIRSALGVMPDYAVPVERVLFHPVFFKSGAPLPKNEFISITDNIPKDSAVSIYPFAGDLDLFELVSVHYKTKTRIAKDVLVRYTKELLHGLKHLHEKGIAHRDIKPENIMLGEGKLKYIDFGLACFYENCEGSVGTPFYIAPEVYDKKMPVEDWDKTDVFSLGNTLFFIMTMGKNVIDVDDRLLKQIMTTTPREALKDDIKYTVHNYLLGTENAVFSPLIIAMTDPDESRRLTAEECLEWVEKNL